MWGPPSPDAGAAGPSAGSTFTYFGARLGRYSWSCTKLAINPHRSSMPAVLARACSESEADAGKSITQLISMVLCSGKKLGLFRVGGCRTRRHHGSKLRKAVI